MADYVPTKGFAVGLLAFVTACLQLPAWKPDKLLEFMAN
jgi:hypothetical protein